MRIIYWFRTDNRVSDNPALVRAVRDSTELLPVTLAKENPVTRWGFSRVGTHRLLFETQSHLGLAQTLEKLGSTLFQPKLPGIQGLINLAKEVRVEAIVCEAIAAPEELSEVEMLRNAGIPVIAVPGSALIGDHALPFAIEQTPVVFSEFRRLLEKAGAEPHALLPTPQTLPPLPTGTVNLQSAEPYRARCTGASAVLHSSFPFHDPTWAGTEQAALAHIERYFSGCAASSYKHTRNELMGTLYSTKFSPWLAVGAISARQIWHRLRQYEAQHGSNDSTYWIWFELLWRDHFRLMMRRYGRQLFHRDGLQRNRPISTRPGGDKALEFWRRSQTGMDLIDAGMRELASTGYLSNRMRQIVASYLIYDLQGDWRGGAAWFEHCLVDFDVHSNQGNWAYIAGVGTDPRGGRRFNPHKQAVDYDSNCSYRNNWSHM
jgi:deoxyribodipyrimidine photo-lyase